MTKKAISTLTAWNKWYSFVLVINILYIILFAVITYYYQSTEF